ncbi:MAG: SufD family Fe-S cluster assembly protein [Veillonellaceae bacterium]|nr:SufD family Fe-S cluster assembly protein [Veillonellaceae bacterium]
MKRELNLLPMTTFRWTKSNSTDRDVTAPEYRPVTPQWSGATEYVQTTAAWRELPATVPADFRGADPASLADAYLRADGTYLVTIPAGVQAQLSLALDFGTASGWRGAIQIELAPEAELDFTMAIRGAGVQGGYLNYAVICRVAEGAVLRTTKVHTGAPVHTVLEHRFVDLAAAATGEALAAEFGAERLFVHSDTRLTGEGATMAEDMIYIADGESHLDLFYNRKQIGKKTDSHLACYGALADRAGKIFRGCIDFVRGAAGSVGNEEDYAVLLSPDVRNVSLPLLLCGEDDVQGNHASSAGQMDRERLFYLMTRGFSEAAAKRMVVEAMLRPVIDRLRDAELRELVLNEVTKKMDTI